MLDDGQIPRPSSFAVRRDSACGAYQRVWRKVCCDDIGPCFIVNGSCSVQTAGPDCLVEHASAGKGALGATKFINLNSWRRNSELSTASSAYTLFQIRVCIYRLPTDHTTRASFKALRKKRLRLCPTLLDDDVCEPHQPRGTKDREQRAFCVTQRWRNCRGAPIGTGTLYIQ